MSTEEHDSIFVRVIELPAVKMARSGSADLGAFDQWWSAVKVPPQSDLCPRDYMWWNPQTQGLEWLFVLPDPQMDTAGYEVFDFPGGWYAVAACKDEEAEIGETSRRIHQWIEGSSIFAAAPEASGRYEMGHVLTPKTAKEVMGYHQMDLFVPIVVK